MCNRACLDFGHNYLLPEEIKGKRVLEVGCLDINGSLRDHVEMYEPSEYIGIDIQTGPRVDRILNAEDILKEFGSYSFDLIISTEMMEHVEKWRDVINNFKDVLRANGIILITTRSEGFGLHGYPQDFWRYSVEDMNEIFSDMEILKCEIDTAEPGVLVKVRKPINWEKKDLSTINLFNINTGTR